MEQFSNCPSLANSCSGKQGICKIYHMMAEMKQNHILRDYREDNLLAIIFQPVKAIAVDNGRMKLRRRFAHRADYHDTKRNYDVIFISGILLLI